MEFFYRLIFLHFFLFEQFTLFVLQSAYGSSTVSTKNKIYNLLNFVAETSIPVNMEQIRIPCFHVPTSYHVTSPCNFTHHHSLTISSEKVNVRIKLCCIEE